MGPGRMKKYVRFLRKNGKIILRRNEDVVAS
jgi:hypothetical protein